MRGTHLAPILRGWGLPGFGFTRRVSIIFKTEARNLQLVFISFEQISRNDDLCSRFNLATASDSKPAPDNVVGWFSWTVGDAAFSDLGELTVLLLERPNAGVFYPAL